MRLYRKRSFDNRDTTENEQPWLKKMADPIARVGIQVQKAFAKHMSQLTGKLSLKKLKTAVVAFCIVCGGFSSYLVITAIFSANGGSTPLKVEVIQTPKHAAKNAEGKVLPYSPADAQVAWKIRAFRMYMDSLRKAGASHYDSILIHRRGLIDSMNKVEEMYQLQPLK